MNGNGQYGSRIGPAWVGTVLCGIGLVLVGAVTLAAQPPAGKTYFTMLLGLEAPYSWEAECLRFTATDLCALGGPCGTWTRTGPAGPESAFTFELSFEERGVPVQIDGQARVDARGRISSFGGAARVQVGNQSAVFGLTGQAAKRRKCKRLLRQWNIDTTPPQPPQDGECLDRAAFPEPARSLYVLPFPAGESYHLSQTYCYLYSTHRNEYAYDFDMPVGAEIVAARAGEVVEVIEDLPNDSPWPDNNRLQIRHDDGTVARYLHVAQNSVVPAVGERVDQGQVIAQAAMSGTIDPHLHFAVYRDFPGVEGEDVAVNFTNAEGPIDQLGGLIQEQFYEALPE